MIEPDAFTRRLNRFAKLSMADQDVLRIIVRTARSVDARVDLEAEGTAPKAVHVLLSGLACRYKITADGERRIVALLVPGDLCDLYIKSLNRIEHSIGTLSKCQMAAVPDDIITLITERHPALARAIACSSLLNEAISREWLVNLGGRPAAQRLAHLLCEMHHRMSSAGLVQGGLFSLSMTQTDLGDATGLTPVHVNRTLQALRGQGLVVVQQRSVAIPDLDRLAKFSDFNPGYLYLDPQTGTLF